MGCFALLPLERRCLLSAVYPTAVEQYLVELINRGRADPAAEAARFGIALNEGLAAGTISTSPKQPLAIDPYLTDAARKHAQWMIDTDTFSHTGAGGSNPGARMASAGYSFIASSGWSENIAWSGSSPSIPDPTATARQLHENLFVDEGIAGRGHRTNLMASASRQIGVGVISGEFHGYNAVMACEDFAYSGSGVFLTGVVYADAVVDDDFYTPGEGLAGITVTARRLSDGALFSATSWASGGYSLALPAGTYQVTASGAGLVGTVAGGTVSIAGENIKVDFVPGADEPPTATLIARRVTSAGGTRYRFVVEYRDDHGIDLATLDNRDVAVIFPSGGSTFARLISYTQPSQGLVAAVYRITPPGGTWDGGDNGIYTVFVRKNAVADTDGDFAVGGPLGTFRVRISSLGGPLVLASSSPSAAYALQSWSLSARSPIGGGLAAGLEPPSEVLAADGQLEAWF